MKTFSFDEFRTSGLLWLINTSVFHPRGYTLALQHNEGQVEGFALAGDGKEPIVYQNDEKLDAVFQAAQTFLAPTNDEGGNQKEYYVQVVLDGGYREHLFGVNNPTDIELTSSGSSLLVRNSETQEFVYFNASSVLRVEVTKA